MKGLKGPKLELSQLKVPRIVRDVYQDLRDRRLLPFVGLILVAILAVPILLSGGGTDSSDEALSPVPPEVAIETSDVEVVRAMPGLREPDKRLSGRRAKDPFKQQFSGAAVSTESVVSETGAATTGTVEADSGGSSSGISEPSPGPQGSGVPSVEGDSGSEGSTGGTGSSPPAGEPDGVVYFTYAADLKIVKTEVTQAGKKVSSEPEVRERVLPSTVLPAPKQQVVTYMGISPKTRKPLFLVSTDVTAIFGDGKCASGTDVCQLLEMEPTFPETFVYGENDVRYKIIVLKVEPVALGKPKES